MPEEINNNTQIKRKDFWYAVNRFVCVGFKK